MRFTPLVSVLTPVYNAEKYIPEAIEGILNQTFRDFEFIIIDDHSTDRTWGIIKEYAQKDKRIIVLKNESNLGIAGNRNKLISLARGKYIVWQDADDISMPTRIQKQYHFMEIHPEVGITGGFLEIINEKDQQCGIRKYALDDKILRKTIFRYSPVAQPAAMVRKKALDEAGIYNLKYPPAEDLDMSFRIGMKWKFANLPEISIKYRESDCSSTFTKLKTMELLTLEIRNKYSARHGYRMTVFDKIYNILQYMSILVLPTKLKIKLFKFIRNS